MIKAWNLICALLHGVFLSILSKILFSPSPRFPGGFRGVLGSIHEMPPLLFPPETGGGGYYSCAKYAKLLSSIGIENKSLGIFNMNLIEIIYNHQDTRHTKI